MEIGVAVIGITSVALCAIPFILTNRNRKIKERKLYTTLQNVAKKHNAIVEEYELFGHYAIGIDQKNKFVFFTSITNEIIQEQYIDLSNILTCEIANIGRNNHKKEKITERLNLIFFPIDVNESNKVLEFYNAETHFQLSGEFQSIQKWNNRIKTLLA
ncbi:hypothetical protein SAMN04488009_1558 [Maribacter sedimenticola]|uniref:Uncharacterized protein n=1 Tax=Maribacter sedimenticola TaxID=228956 RepID=A0ABY1SFI5_9FLAO|nr:hypothetical protein [Maribacter sedimenticola]SNR42079.1 hypothetical protein SAMN04488009_1558 [Maribacter sedimenticola]